MTATGGDATGAVGGLPRALRMDALRTGVAGFVARRVLVGIATLLLASVLIFLAVRVLPGDPASNVLGRGATPTRVAELRAQLGLDKPLVDQYIAWLGDLAHGSLGNSVAALAAGSPAGSSAADLNARLATPLWNSVALASLTTVAMILLSVVLGTLAGARVGGALDKLISLTALSFLAMPEVVLGSLLLLLFFTELNVLPPTAVAVSSKGPFGAPLELILPMLALLGVTVGSGARLVRIGVADAMGQDYIEAARLNGVSERSLLFKYALKNSVGPAIQVMSQNVQYLFGGIIVVEALFAYPGIGGALVQAIGVRDATTVTAISIVLAGAYIAINIVADLLTVLFVPRLRTEL